MYGCFNITHIWLFCLIVSVWVCLFDCLLFCLSLFVSLFVYLFDCLLSTYYLFTFFYSFISRLFYYLFQSIFFWYSIIKNNFTYFFLYHVFLFFLILQLSSVLDVVTLIWKKDCNPQNWKVGNLTYPIFWYRLINLSFLTSRKKNSNFFFLAGCSVWFFKI